MTWETALAYETDWTWVNWLSVAVLTAVTVIWTLSAATVATWVSDRHVGYSRGATAVKTVMWLAWVAVSCGAALVLLVLPGSVMRHIPSSGVVLVLFFTGIAASIALAIWGLWGAGNDVPLFGYVPAVALFLGVLLGGVNDWLHRVAASIPTSVAVLVLTPIVLVVAGVLWAKSDAR
ncbi:hypothetical protein [Microbacterium amylolyticum]|uniref:Uncharacterized protein n=1 Tax=Microbacterium amylolyticum TaxID=936337 RepID=A0ABS4ZKQ4_9MICO|nr:hypothetical protein [Microbacterium amylolyticum]MBP2437876.1 hypothetical protein [Microbacterium amylolyticum]